jgi:hypothetical protein
MFIIFTSASSDELRCAHQGMEIRSSFEISIIAGARWVWGHVRVSVCLGGCTGLRACISGIASDG